MLVNYCPNCSGHPFTTDLRLPRCPLCGGTLSSELVGESDLSGRKELPSALDSPQADESVWDPYEANAAITFANYNSTGFYSWAPVGEPQESLPDTGCYGSDQPREDATWNQGSPSTETDHVPAKSAANHPTHDSRVNAAVPDAMHAASVTKLTASSVGSTVCGRVANYSNSESEAGSYRRLFIQRLADAVVYGQRFEDLVHRFTVRMGSDDPLSGSYVDVPVNVHGTIAGGMQLVDNAEVEVTGRYKNGVLMARRIDVINGAARTTVQLQHDVKGTAIVLAVLAFLTLLAAGGFASGGALFGGIGSFMATWLVMSGIVAAVWLFLLSRMGIVAQLLFLRDGRFPFVAILAIGLLLALAIVNAFGLGNTAGDLVDSLLALLDQLMVPIIVVFGIALMVSGILK